MGMRRALLAALLPLALAGCQRHKWYVVEVGEGGHVRADIAGQTVELTGPARFEAAPTVETGESDGAEIDVEGMERGTRPAAQLSGE